MRPFAVLPLLLAAPLLLASPADATDFRTPLFLSRTRVVLDSPAAPPLTLFGRADPQDELDYVSFAVELLAYVAKEVLPDSPDEFYGNSNLPSTWSDSMPETPHDFAGHCLEVVQDIGDALSTNAPADLPAVGDTRSTFSRAFAQGVGAAVAVHEVYKAIDRDIEPDRRSDVFSISPKVGSNKIAVALTLRW